MPITWATGNMFETDADIIINTVNCVGVMGKGVALQVKNKYPWVMPSYLEMCRTKSLKPGMIIMSQKKGEPLILNMATKAHWRDPSQLAWVEKGILELRSMLQTWPHRNNNKIVMPRPGCGLGGLDWEKQVKPLVIKYLGDLPNNIWVY